MAPRPVLGELELVKVQSIVVDDDQVLVEHGVPALEGDFLQRLGRRASKINLRGFVAGSEVLESLKNLRDKLRAAEPVSFVADIATATRVDEVLIEEMGVRELAGKPERFEYAFLLREFIPPPPTQREKPPQPVIPPPPSVETGTLIVDVIVEGQPSFDFSTVTISITGTEESGTSLNRTLTNRIDNRWTEEEFPPGEFIAEAVVIEPEAMSGSEPAIIQAGQTTIVSITLHPGVNIAKAFVVHFWFDKAFIEPCLRPVMREVAEYAAAHSDEKLIIVGHTDLVGSDDYNQSLSERRSRSAYAYLTFGRDKTTALDEWDQLRQNRPVGQLPSIHDTWSVREYQYMLQDIGYYIGSIDEDHGPKTDAAIRGFQQDNGLTVNGTVDNPTWQALIDAYLGQDNLSVSEDQFIVNTKDGCDGGIVKWLGCGEKDPVRNTQDAWRPNRRTEFLFTKVTILPCEIPKPTTFDLPEPIGSDWCLGPGDPDKRCCFTTREVEQPGKLLIRPARPGKTLVNGVITFEDGTPVANAKYSLIAPDGEYLHTDSNGNPDIGERPQQPNRGRPIPDRADENGRFSYPRQTSVGSYILELFDLEEPEIARGVNDPPQQAKGNVICLELDQEPEIVQRDLELGAILPQLHALIPSIFIPQIVIPIISISSSIVVLKKNHTNPVRIEVNLVTITLVGTTFFHPNGILTRSNNISAVRLFPAATGGTEITFNGIDNAFSGADLQAGVTLFAEAGPNPSGALDDYTLILTLAPSTFPQVGLPATTTMTAVELTLDIFMSRTITGVDPAPLLQPPETPPAAGTVANDKWFGGRFVHLQDTGDHHGRAMLVISQVQPAAFTGDLVLRQVAINGNNITGLDPDTKVQTFDNEIPRVGEVAKNNPHEFNASTIPVVGGLRLFAEGQDVSTNLRDTGFQLGIKDVEDDGDRVRMTVVQFSNLQADIPSTPANSPRLGNSPVARHTISRGTGAVLNAADFDEDFATNEPLVLLEGSVLAANSINMSVQVTPAGVPVSWSIQRDTRPAPNGDHADIIAFSPNSEPTLTPNAANQLQATLITDAVGSFHIRPFIDINGNSRFDHRIDLEPFIIMNLVLVRATLNQDNSIARSANFLGTATGGGGIGVSSGTFNIANPATTAMHMNVEADIIGGGRDGRLGLNSVFSGWINNESANEDIVGIFQDTSVAPPVNRFSTSVFASNSPSVLGSRIFLPVDSAPVLVAPPLLDSGRLAAGSGGDTATLTRSRIRAPRTNLALGQRLLVEAVDSPGDGSGPIHPGFPFAGLTRFRFGLDFSAFLCLWTNISHNSGATGDPSDRLYTVLRQVDWRMRGEWSIDPATGAVGIITLPAVSITNSTTFTPIAAAVNTSVEVRPPTGLSLLARDARV